MRSKFIIPIRIRKSTAFFLFGIVLVLVFVPFSHAQHAIETIAGGSIGDGSLAVLAPFSPSKVCVDSAGEIYIADCAHNRIRKVDASGIISTVAGSGESAGFSGDGGLAINAVLNYPNGFCIDSSGNLYIADTDNHRIRKIVKATGIITTIAGDGNGAYAGDGGLAINASLNGPSDVAVDATGTIYIADTYNHRIRKITAGVIQTVAGNGTNSFAGDGGAATSASLDSPIGLYVNQYGYIYIADTNNQRIRKVDGGGDIHTIAGDGNAGYAGDGSAAVSASLFNPYGVIEDSTGTIFIADAGNHRIRFIDGGGDIHTAAGDGTEAYAGDGGAAGSASLSSPNGVAVDSSGTIYIADTYNNRIRKVDNGGIISTIAGNGWRNYSGDGGLATNASLTNPDGIFVTDAGLIYIADEGNHCIREVTLDGTIRTVAGNGIEGYAGDGGAATNASLDYPSDVCVDSSGNLYIADYTNHRIRKVDKASGIISTAAGDGNNAYAGDGGLATSASLFQPEAVCLDSAGNLYIADSGNYRIRKVLKTSGIISTVAGNGTQFYSGDGGPATSAAINESGALLVDSEGAIYFADSRNSRIRKVDPLGTISLLSGNGTATFSGDGGPAINASLNGPYGLYVDSVHTIYIADSYNNRIRKVDPSTGFIDTIAGDGNGLFAGDHGAAINASLNYPCGVCVDSKGNIYISDTDNNRIRKIVNHIPASNPQTVSTNEDNAVAITLAASDSDGDPVTYTVETMPANGTLSGATPNLTYTPNPDFYGTETFTYKAYDTYAYGNIATVTITVNSVNDAPSFTKGADQTINEDAAAQSIINWATAISAGPANEASQMVYFNINNSNNALFAALPAVNASGTLTYTPAADAYGSATVYIAARDPGGSANGGVNFSATQTFTITINPINDAPSFFKGADQTVLEDAAAQSVVGWATSVSAGPANESGQALIFSATTDNSALFSALPAIDYSGKLTYTPAANAVGVASVTVTLQDNGGTANGGIDSTLPQNFTITVLSVNDAPSFTKGADQTVNEDAAPQSITAWATAISNGPLDEATQTLTFNLINTNSALFAAQPAVNASGTLTYILFPDAYGSATVSVALYDNGGRVNGGVNLSATQTFTLTVNPVNDAPGFTKGANQNVAEDAGPQSVAGWATAIIKGSTNEASQVLTFNVSNSNPGLFSSSPAIDANGTLTYALAPNANGNATATVILKDNGGTANGGVDSSAPQTFSINVSPVNDAPFALGNSFMTPVATPLNLVLGGYDIENSPITYAVVTNPAHGSLSGTAPFLTYTPNVNFLDVDTFTFKVNDGALDSATATITIAINSPPTAVDDAAETWMNHAVAVNALDNDSDPDDDSLTITVVTQGAHGSVIHDGTQVTYTPNASYTGADSFTYTINDGNGQTDTASVSVTVYELVVADAGSDIVEELGKAIPLNADAVGGDGSYAFSWGIVSGSSTLLNQLSSLTVQNPTFTPTIAGTYVLQCTASEAVAPSATDTLRVTVTHRPAVQNLNVNANENTGVGITLTGSDADNEALTFQILSNPGSGALSNFNAQTGTLTYTPILHFWGVDTFTYTASDGLLTSAPKTVTVTVANTVNDPPVADPVTAETVENTAVFIQMTSSDPDGYGARLYQIVSNPTHGSLSNLNAYSGTVLYTPHPGYSGSDSFTYRAVDADNGGVSEPAGVAITVQYVEKPPTATPTSTAIVISTPTPTNTSVSTLTPKPTNTAASTPTPKPTNTAASTPTPKPTNTAVSTLTPKPTNTVGNTPTPTPTSEELNTPTPTRTAIISTTPTPTNVEANTPTATPTAGEAYTPTPTPTVTPTPVPPTPTPIVAIVTDNSAALADLSNGVDWDYTTQRILSVQWDLELAGVDPSDVRDIHLYVEVDGSGQFNYLGRTTDGMATGFDWKAKAPLAYRDYRQGPMFGHSYRFRIFALTETGDPVFYGPFDSVGPVDFRPAVIVTDDGGSEEDLSNGVDRDAAENRSLAIRWTFDEDLVTAENVKEFHVYVRSNNQAYAYLGTTRSADSTYLEWKPTTSKAFNVQFRQGPQFGTSYQFKVYALTKSRTPVFYGPFATQGFVNYQQGD